MTTRVQEENYLRNEAAVREPHIRTLEKAMLYHADLSCGAVVLDGNVCSGQLAGYLLQHTNCQVCGVSDRMEEVRQTRARLDGGDFVYAAVGDIPWQNDTFDAVLLHPCEGGLEALKEQLRESKRVLRPGGRLVLGLRRLPPVLDRLLRLLGDGLMQEAEVPSAEEARSAMSSFGFEEISQSSAGLCGHVLCAKLKKEA